MKRTTQREFNKKLFEKLGNDYECIGQYVNAKTYIEILHIPCNKIFKARPNNLLQGYGCPYCFKKELLTQEQFEKQVKELGNDEYEVLGNYINNKTKVLIRHKVCGEEYLVLPRNFVQGKRCAKCAKCKPLNNEIFEKRLYELYGDEYSRVSEYNGINNKIIVRHNLCKNLISQTPKVILSQRFGCKFCKMTAGESRISIALEELNIKYIFQKSFPECKDKYSLPFDFYFQINNNDFAIEYDGRQHYIPIFGHSDEEKNSNLNKSKLHDEIKNKFCKENNIHLLRIPYTEDYRNIPKLISDFISMNTDGTPCEGKLSCTV